MATAPDVGQAPPSSAMTRRRLPVIAAAAVLFVVTLAWRVLTFWGFQNDHYVHLARAQQILLGDWPVRDFVDPGMPLMYAASAAAWWLWGGSPGTELLLIAAAFALGAACTVVAAHRMSGSILIASGVALVEAMITPRTYSYPKVLLYAAAAWAILAFIDVPSRRRVAVLAAVTAVAFLFRHDHGLYIGVSALAAIALAGRGAGSRVAARHGALLAGVAALLVLPWFAFVAYHQGLIEYVASGIEFSRAESRNSSLQSLPRFNLSRREGLVLVRPSYRPSAVIEWKPETPDATRRALEAKYGLEPVAASDSRRWQYYGRDPSPAMRALVNDPHVSDVTGLDRITEWSRWDGLLAWLSPRRLERGPGLRLGENAYIWLFYLFHALPVACAVAAWRRRIAGCERWKGESAAVGALAVMAVLVNVGLLRGNLPVWLPDAVVPAALLGAWAVPVAWKAAWRYAWMRLTGRAGLLMAAGVTVAAVMHVGNVREQIDRTRLRDGIEGISARVADLRSRLWGRHRDLGLPPSGVSEALLPFFDYVGRCTSVDDRLVMTRLYPDVFVMAERGFGGGHVAFLEGFYWSQADQQRTLDRLRRESVPFVLLIGDREDAFRRSFHLLSAYIDRRYELMAEIPLERTSSVRVLVEKDRRGVKDAATEWPCFT